ncbi:predicted protein [Aspergillus nidulans FGSC A4]|uniref:Uncharacterized protein n=1 Tax=Emericella nidulans (strain FGSC A4 / ATCC 38163 / CBS 112.46 / NRRL 194 / M139) TaxID=227321 RepID=Q5AR43_EMENI|nr:hypothetical protein [Aspergillus nidulans FGSC A4]XP_682506.1 hypothetical protein [Aspergillus nidulans FGSC A4]EAA62199.1 predicted protein [Aspergillus nidulans FGSC A4]EAA65161.1 predicted protein [Aspergillus nidulans FGSC A4]CBF82246.1 TPA: conserved hypothetical protein [Aspergillus nidulans FGSC A4]CBF87221.1 TPA: conserved hypothetical protein [Aspergillus nidulans FGSC A4]|eukprot:XP_662853.1 predicted protein [Aspergillus nidulans FGSC A4]
MQAVHLRLYLLLQKEDTLARTYHPQTDRSTERINRVSPFYLSHRYNLSLFSLTEEVEQLAEEPAKSPIQKGEAIVQKVKEALDWA